MLTRNQTPTADPHDVYRLGGIVSIIQSALFIHIALCALGLGIDNFISSGFGDLHRQSPRLFVALCTSFVLIATLGLAITPAEKKLIAGADDSLATWGSNLAYLGHMGTIAFFSWWLAFVSSHHDDTTVSWANVLLPLKWGLTFELFFVGAWVWIMAYVIFRHQILSKRFGIISIAKATSFWFALAGLFVNDKWWILSGVMLVTAVFGPWWHMWIALRFFLREEASATTAAR